MILMKCENGHYTSHFELKRGGVYCPICGSKTAEVKQSELNKPKWKPRERKKSWAIQRELF
jgi:uncharacterized Zn finger protein (UPF0148 family)